MVKGWVCVAVRWSKRWEDEAAVWMRKSRRKSRRQKMASFIFFWSCFEGIFEVSLCSTRQIRFGMSTEALYLSVLEQHHVLYLQNRCGNICDKLTKFHSHLT